MSSAQKLEFERRETPAGDDERPASAGSEAGVGAMPGPERKATAGLARRVEVQTVLYNLTDRLHRAESRAASYDAAMDAMFDGLACQRASILLFDKTGLMKFVAWRGLSEGYRRAVEGHSPWTREDANARPILIGDIDAAELDDSLKQTIRAEGIGALGFFPLVAEGQLIGKFMGYYDRPQRFEDATVELGLTIARQLAFALSRIAAAEARRRLEKALIDIADAERARLLEIEAVMDSVPAAIWVARDAECSVITGNRAAYAMFRETPGDNISISARRERPLNFIAYWNGRALATDELPLRRAVLYGEQVRDFDIEYRFNDGAVRHMVANATPLRDAHGNVTGGVAAFIDVSEKKRFGAVQEHLAAIVEFSDDAIISKDTNGTILTWNQGAERLFGYRAEEIIGKKITTIVPEHLLDEEPQILRRIRNGERIDHYETVRRRKDGTLVDISLTVSPMRNAKGEIVAASKIARDISDKKKAEAQYNLLIAELNHRVKNTLATVVSIARQCFSGPETREARAAFNARIRGLAQSHARLAEADWTSIDLQSLFADEFAPYRRGGNVQIVGPPVALSPKCALTLGLAVHELATNAAKYGALSTDKGVVDVSWIIDPDDGSLAISWQERGGPPVTPPSRTGFGRLLLERAVAADLKSRISLDFAPDGLRFIAIIPSAQYRAQLP